MVKTSGVLTLTMVGEDKDQIRDILNSIANNYVAQNVARKIGRSREKPRVPRSAASTGAQASWTWLKTN